MRFGTIGMKRPEDFPQLFNVYAQGTQTSARGRERNSVPEFIGQKRCILSIAKPEEQQRYEQIGVTVTHAIFHSGIVSAAKENDIFALVKNGEETRYFRVQAIQNHGEMNVFTTYYCEERGDINGLYDQSVWNSAGGDSTG